MDDENPTIILVLGLRKSYIQVFANELVKALWITLQHSVRSRFLIFVSLCNSFNDKKKLPQKLLVMLSYFSFKKYKQTLLGKSTLFITIFLCNMRTNVSECFFSLSSIYIKDESGKGTRGGKLSIEKKCFDSPCG